MALLGLFLLCLSCAAAHDEPHCDAGSCASALDDDDETSLLQVRDRLELVTERSPAPPAAAPTVDAKTKAAKQVAADKAVADASISLRTDLKELISTKDDFAKDVQNQNPYRTPIWVKGGNEDPLMYKRCLNGPSLPQGQCCHFHSMCNKYWNKQWWDTMRKYNMPKMECCQCMWGCARNRETCTGIADIASDTCRGFNSRHHIWDGAPPPTEDHTSGPSSPLWDHNAPASTRRRARRRVRAQAPPGLVQAPETEVLAAAAEERKKLEAEEEAGKKLEDEAGKKLKEEAPQVEKEVEESAKKRQAKKQEDLTMQKS